MSNVLRRQPFVLGSGAGICTLVFNCAISMKNHPEFVISQIFKSWSNFSCNPKSSRARAPYSSKQCNDQRTEQTAFFLAPIITDFIRNTKRELYDEKLEDALEMLDLEWSKDDNTKTQCNQLNASPLHRGNASNKNGPARVKRRMQWEAPSKPLAVDDPLLLPEREVHEEIGINWFQIKRYRKEGMSES